MSELTQNLAIVCASTLIALFMLRESVRAVAKREYFVFALRLPLRIRWLFAGGKDAAKVDRIVSTAEAESDEPRG